MLKSHEGQSVPVLSIPVMTEDGWSAIDTEALFKNRTVVVFSLPGAFTPTCSASHLPRYIELASAFKSNGVDEIVCVSVNDTFAMNAWSQDQNSKNITLLPDGNGEFTKGMGMLVDKSAIGFGNRSWRYSMLVNNGVVRKMFIEEEVAGDPFEVSDADTMLNYINPEAKKPDFVTLFTKSGCPHCTGAKKLLTDKGFSFEEVEIGNQITSRTLQAVAGRTSTPQIFIAGKHIGGFDELQSYLNNAAVKLIESLTKRINI